MAVVRNLMVRAGADFSGLKKEMDKAQKQMQDFKRSMNSALKGIGTAIAGIGAGLYIKDAVSDAMKFEASIEQVNRLMGESAREFMKWADTQALAFNMSKSEALSYGATFSNIISTFTKSTKETQLYTQDLLQATAIVASKTGRTMEDALERVRSGMLGNTEAIEDLGVFVNVSMIESTKAFQQFANNKSWAQLDFQTQQQIRLFAILEQAAEKYGSEISNNAVSQTARLVAQLGNLRLAIGQAFLPIWEKVLPPLTAMVSWLTKAANAVAQFMQVLFGKSSTSQIQSQAQATQSQTSAVNDLGKSYKKAGKEAKKAQGFLASFDEVNTLPDKNTSEGSSGDGGGGGVGDVGSSIPTTTPINFETNAPSISAKIKEMAENFKKFISPAIQFFKSAWKEASTYFKEKVAEMTKIWTENKDQFIQAMKNIWKFTKPIFKWIGKFIWDSIKGAIDGAIQFLEGLVKFIAGAFTGDWKKAFSGIKDMVVGAFKFIWNFFALKFVKGLFTGIGSLVTNFAKGFKDIVTKIKGSFNGIDKWFKGIGDKMWKMIKDSFSAVSNWFKLNDTDKIISVLSSGSFLKNVLTKAGDIYKKILSAFANLKTWFTTKFSDIYKALSSSTLLKSISSKANEIWGKIKSAFSSLKSWFSSKFSDVFKALGDSTLLKNITSKANEIWGKIKSAFSTVKAWFVNKFSDIYKALSDGGILKSISTKANDIWNKVKSVFSSVKSWFVTKFNGIPSALSDGSLLKNVLSNASKIWGKVKSAFNDVKTWFTNKFSSIATVLSYSSLLKNVWNGAVGIYSKIKSAFETIKTWFITKYGAIASALLDGTLLKNVSSNAKNIYAKIKSVFTELKTWFITRFDGIQSALSNGTLLANVSSKASAIYSRIKSSFSTVKSWFGSKFNDISSALSSSTLLKNVQTAASKVWGKVKSAFTSVQSWFDTNVGTPITRSINKIQDSFKNGIANSLKSVLNRFIGMLNNAISNFNSFKNKIPGVGGLVPNIPKIPALAKGGITNGPTLALIGDNPGGQEVVSPLDKLENLIASAVGTAVMQANQASRSNGSSGDLILNIDGRTFGRLIKPFIDQENRRVGNNVKLNPI